MPSGRIDRPALLVIIIFFTFFSCVSRPDAVIVEDRNIPLIIIDAGHGGKDNGAVASYQIADEIITFREKDISLEIAKLLAANLRVELPQIEIILTRIEDVNLSLEERVLKSKQASGNISKVIFISIHLNYSPNEDASGMEVYYYLPVLLDPNAYITVQYLKNTIRNNAPLAQSIMNAVGSIPELEDISRSLKNADYYVLRNAVGASVLIECGFLSNEREALLLSTTSYQEKLVEGIALGIKNFLNTNNDYSFF